MIVFLNGQFLPEEEARISVFDRGFLYGDGLFETLRVCRGRLFRWHEHWDRFARGMEFLKLKAPFGQGELLVFANELLARNEGQEGTLRFTLSRGAGGRGYSLRGAENPTLLMTTHPAPPLQLKGLHRWDLITSSSRLLPHERLAQFKTCNKLPQILARAEAEAVGAQEALLLNSEGWVVEGAASNLFWISKGVVCTPAPDSGILPGVTRTAIQELCRELNLEAKTGELKIEQLYETEGVFVSLSSIGVAEAVSLDGKPLPRSPLTERIHDRFVELVFQECGAP